MSARSQVTGFFRFGAVTSCLSMVSWSKRTRSQTGFFLLVEGEVGGRADAAAALGRRDRAQGSPVGSREPERGDHRVGAVAQLDDLVVLVGEGHPGVAVVAADLGVAA
ncbi:hypothetical protein V1L54_11570 [Streptomyces sp. TRM 70361]|nr:hypothetical protein [Streptomyces sp. TRM 70361]MEE1940026.1 hypothetical protein [Streptomyces sp. TRM 70361]